MKKTLREQWAFERLAGIPRMRTAFGDFLAKAFDALFKLSHRKGLVQFGPTAPGRLEPVVAIAGGEYERNAAREELLGSDRRFHRAG